MIISKKTGYLNPNIFTRQSELLPRLFENRTYAQLCCKQLTGATPPRLTACLLNMPNRLYGRGALRGALLGGENWGCIPLFNLSPQYYAIVT